MCLKRIHRTVILPQGCDRQHPSCIANSGTILSVGPSGETTFSNSKCACLKKPACPFSLFLLPELCWYECLGSLFTSVPADCTKGGILRASYISKNRCIVLKHWKGKFLFFLMECITLAISSHGRPSNLGSVICKCIAYKCMYLSSYLQVSIVLYIRVFLLKFSPI